MVHFKCSVIICCCLMVSCHRQAVVNADEYTNDISQYRTEQLNTLIADPRQPLTELTAKKTAFFKPDPSYQLTAQVIIAEDQKPFEMNTYSGQIQAYIKYADLVFSLHDKELTLEAYKNVKTLRIPGLNNKLFVPFKDVTNGDTSYGGGRYIYLLATDIKNNSITLDFNKSFNPYCAYADGFNCPIPPSANHLTLAIPVGEKDFIK